MTSSLLLRRRLLLLSLLPLSALGTAPAAILLLRHAEAPGTGDPANFRLDDCGTQRNLSEAGRSQARRIGQHLRAKGVAVKAVWHSPWCRTRETAQLAFPGMGRDEPAFASFFQDRARSGPQTQAALKLLRAWDEPGVLLVVTHQVNITALVGKVPSQGDGYWVRFEGEQLRVQSEWTSPAP